MPRTPPAVVAAPRRKPGRGSQVTPVERREIQRLHLADGMSQRQIATHTGRTRETVAAQLKGDDYERIRGELETDLIETVQRQLKNHAGTAVNAWVKALDRAAQKGNHKPSKDLLLHMGIIEPLGGETAAGARVAIVIGTVPAPTDEELEAAQAREEARRTRATIDVDSRDPFANALPAPFGRVPAPKFDTDSWVYPGFPTLFWGLSGFCVGDLMGKALWKLVENAARFPRRGGRVLCVHGAVSFHRARPCGPRWLPGRGAMRHVELDRRVLGLQSTGE